MTTSHSAWLLVPYGVQPFAVAAHEVIEYLNRIVPQDVPTTPEYCSSVLFWRDHIVPLMDFGACTGHPLVQEERHAAILAYQLEPATPLHYVAIALQEPPTRIWVSDDMACDLPEAHAMLWQRLAKSCFTNNGVATPIVSLEQLCSAAFRSDLENLENIFADYRSNPHVPPAPPKSEAQMLKYAGVDDTHVSQHDHLSVDGIQAPLTSGRYTQSIPLIRELNDLNNEFLSDLQDEDFEDLIAEDDFDDLDELDDLDDLDDLDEELDHLDTSLDLLDDDLDDLDLVDLVDDGEDLDNIDLDDWELEDDLHDVGELDDALAELEDFDEELAIGVDVDSEDSD
ncbi:MAG: hypothetical protein ETSY1_09635 [Candidatus Entotheonella factor]|uniref:CheW-like domain-containing protein n=1 Tax=Entotheonella factor TaxID=1429438 RepID=W4LSC4_ENTF1|nr:MAG: hypothetical protein ETSY1_09635 [Candidatus Entotheonella factor]